MSLAGCFFVSRKYCKLKLASYECCGGGLNEQRVSLFSGKRTGMEWNGMEWKSTVIHENLFLCSYSV